MNSTQSNTPRAAGEAAHYCRLDTFPAELRNGLDVRIENVAEICDLSPGSGGLLCYANPEHAAFILRACNSHAALVAALGDALSLAYGLAYTEFTIDRDSNRTPARLAIRDKVYSELDRLHAALAQAKA